MFRSGNDTVIIYDSRDAILLIPQEALDNTETDLNSSEDTPKKRARRIKAYPAKWADSFGEGYYTSLARNSNESGEDEWIIESSGSVYRADTAEVTSQEEAARHIKTILEQIGVKDE